MSYYDIPIEEIHNLKDKLKNLNIDCSNLAEILKLSELIDSMLSK